MLFHITGGMMVATVLAEVLSIFWSSRTVNVWPFNEYNMPERFLKSALISNFVLVVALKYALWSQWMTSSWFDLIILTIWLTLGYACLEGPHRVTDKDSLIRFSANVLHKMSVITVILVTLYVLGDLSDESLGLVM
ncbi:uncharacterized protein LOC112573885 [Pomacea canaliculata]|nr:uncharacterized protein LOC112573885 [Pomacea canaliculata]XP_025110332.1 uncharacterized protein LOC112573885 [Pomacea canaliculata]